MFPSSIITNVGAICVIFEALVLIFGLFYFMQSAFPMLPSRPTYYFDPSNGSLIFMPVTIPSIFHQLHTDNFLANAGHDD